MTNVVFKVNKSMIKHRKDIFNNPNLNNLVLDLLNNESWTIFIKDIKDFFNVRDFNKLCELLDVRSRVYRENDYLSIYASDFNIIVSYFYSFKDFYNEGKVGSLKGTFLELFTYKYLELKYPNSSIYRESRMFYKEFVSSMLIDFVVELENGKFRIFECKFSKKGFKRNYLDNLYSISKVCSFCEVFVITLDLYDDFYNYLYDLRENTSKEKFNKIMYSINILSLEHFEEGYFLI